MTIRSLRWILAAVSCAALLAACGGEPAGEPADEGDEAPADAAAEGQVDVAATEFAFALPEDLPAGKTTFTLTNSGEEKHEFALVELKEGAPPVEELVKLSEKESEKFIKFVGGIRPIPPGTTSDKPFTTTLKSGTTYGYACFVRSPEKKKAHAELGMFGSFAVE